MAPKKTASTVDAVDAKDVLSLEKDSIPEDKTEEIATPKNDTPMSPSAGKNAGPRVYLSVNGNRITTR